MPEAAVNEDDLSVSGQDNIRPAGQIRSILPESETKSVDN
jgi:hypothetical protein